MSDQKQRPKITSFTQLDAWQNAHKLVLMLYKETRSFPEDEKFGLTSQLRRAAVSITSNIAEGFAKANKKDKDKFYNIALGSLAEVQNQTLIARDLQYMNEKRFRDCAELSVTVSKLLNGLVKKSKSKQSIHDS